MKTILIILANFLCLIGFSQDPSVQWQKSFGGGSDDRASTIEQTSDGGYIIGGNSRSIDGDVTLNHGNYDYWIVKTNSTGILQWQKTFGGSGSENLTSLKQTSDGGYILCGESNSTDGDVTFNHGGIDNWAVKLDNLGAIEWEKSFGGTGADFVQSIQQTSDNGYIIAAYTSSNDGDVTGNHGSLDFWVYKLDASGSIEWQKTLGGTYQDRATGIRQTTDNGYIVAGYTSSNNFDVSSNHGDFDYWLVKLNANGIIEWQKTYGGSSYDACQSVQQTSDNGFILGGYSRSNNMDVTDHHGNIDTSDFWIVKTDFNGTMQWKKSFGGTKFDNCFSIQQTSDNGYIAVGYTYSNNDDISNNNGQMDYWVIKLNSNGILEWEKSLGGSNWDDGKCVKQTSDGGYIIVGSSSSNDGFIDNPHGSYDYWVVKLNPSSVGLSELKNNQTHFSLYPNPAKDYFILSSNRNLINENYKLINTFGQIVLSGMITDNSTKVDISSLSSGFYTLQIGDEQKSTYKFIKE